MRQVKHQSDAPDAGRRLASCEADEHSARGDGQVEKIVPNQSGSSGPHIVLYGMFGIGNTGNDATLEATLAALRTRLPGARFTVVASEPDRVQDMFGVPSAPIRADVRGAAWAGPAQKVTRELSRWADARALMRTADCLVIPGTGILDDFGATVMGHAYHLWRWCVAARQADASVKFVSVGAGPAEKAWSRRLFRMAAQAADHRSYRDEASKAFVRDVLKLDVTRDAVTPDLVFGLDVSAPVQRAEIKTIGVGVMDYHSWLGDVEQGDAYEPYIEKMTLFGVWLLQQGKRIRVLTGDSGDDGAVRDFVSRLKAAAPASAVDVPEISTLRQLCSEIGYTDAVVATRYHTIVAALICGRPAVSIGYAAKNRAVMREFGAGAYCQDIGDFDLDRLKRQFNDATAAGGAERLRAVAADLRERVDAHFDTVAGEIAARTRDRA